MATCAIVFILLAGGILLARRLTHAARTDRYYLGTLLQAGMILSARGNLRAAVPVFIEAGRLHRGNLIVQEYLYRAVAAGMLVEDVVAAYRDYLAEYPTDGRARYALGLGLYKLDHVIAARAEWEAVPSIDDGGWADRAREMLLASSTG